MHKSLRIKDEVDATTGDACVSKTKAHNNNVHSLCLLDFSAIFLVFVRASFL